MTAETTSKPPDVDPSSAAVEGIPDLRTGLARLLSTENVSKLDPYRTRLGDIDRLRVFNELCRARGRRYVQCSLDTFDWLVVPKESGMAGKLWAFVEAMPERLSAGTGGLVLLGPPGTGKDHLLMGVMREAIVRHGFNVEWFDGLRLFATIKSNIGAGTVEKLLDRLSTVQLLAISDPIPPRDALSTYELSVLRDIVERRYSQAMGTWITTNVQTSEDATRLFTDAVLSRLLDGATELFCDWPSYRSPKR